MKITRNLRQNATWWATASDGFGGNTFSAPIAVKCRWEDINEVIPGPRNLAGGIDREQVSNAVVFIDRDISVGDYLYLGVSIVADPTTVSKAIKVQLFNRVTDLRNVEVLRKAVL